MIGGVFGRTNGIATGCEASLTWKKLEFSINNEYVFATGSKSGNFYYNWSQLTYTPVEWLMFGGVAQHTKTVQTKLDVQRPFLGIQAQEAGVHRLGLQRRVYRSHRHPGSRRRF